MMGVALAGLAVAVGLGLWLAALHARAVPRKPGAGMRLAHGLAGSVGLAATLAVLSDRGWHGSPYIWDAVGLLAAALAMGLLYWRAWGWLGAQRGMVLVVHGVIAASGAAIVAGWLLG